MKKSFYLYTISTLLLLIFSSCDKETSVTLPDIGDVTYEIGYGEIAFEWSFPEQKDVEYVRVDFISEGESKLYTFSRFSEEAIVTGLNAEEYNFSIRTADKNGNLSAPVLVTATPLEPPYKIVAKTLKMEPVVGGINVRWENPTGKSVQINVEYIDNAGSNKIFTLVSSELEGKRSVLDVSGEEQVFSCYTSNPMNFLQFSEIKTVAIKPYEEIRFEDRDQWVVLDFSSQRPSDPPSMLFDGDPGTYWQTDWTLGANDPFPHHVAFDMGSSRVVTKLAFWNRDHQNANNAPTDFTVEGSLDGENWSVYGSYTDFPTDRGKEITYALDSLPNIRYIRITFSNPRNGVHYFALAEIYVFGAFI